MHLCKQGDCRNESRTGRKMRGHYKYHISTQFQPPQDRRSVRRSGQIQRAVSEYPKRVQPSNRDEREKNKEVPQKNEKSTRIPNSAVEISSKGQILGQIPLWSTVEHSKNRQGSNSDKWTKGQGNWSLCTRAYIDEMTQTGYMNQEKKEDEDSPALRIA